MDPLPSRRRFLCSVPALALIPAGLSQPARAAEERRDQGFARFLAGVRTEALAQGISRATVSDALSGLSPLPRVLELDRRQPEFTLSFTDYLARVVNPARVSRGRELAARHAALLGRVARRFHVPPSVIVALWGIESDFGRVMGNFPEVPALATLAYRGRRAAYFRGELLDSLRILEEERLPASALKGSWAGAMGQTQFMPSTFLRYAVDFDHHGRRDIWHNLGDVFASTANYLAAAGWQEGEGWGREVRLPRGFNYRLAGPGTARSAAAWDRLGVRDASGARLREARAGEGPEGTLVLPDGEGGPAYLVQANYRVLMRWNHSSYFVLAVGTLADRIAHR